MDEFINAAVELIAAFQNLFIAARAYNEAGGVAEDVLATVIALRPESSSDLDAGMYEALERVGLTPGDQVYQAVVEGLRVGNAELN